jgi:hypothetical protein
VLAHAPCLLLDRKTAVENHLIVASQHPSRVNNRWVPRSIGPWSNAVARKMEITKIDDMYFMLQQHHAFLSSWRCRFRRRLVCCPKVQFFVMVWTAKEHLIQLSRPDLPVLRRYGRGALSPPPPQRRAPRAFTRLIGPVRGSCCVKSPHADWRRSTRRRPQCSKTDIRSFNKTCGKSQAGARGSVHGSLASRRVAPKTRQAYWTMVQLASIPAALLTSP